MVSVFLPKIWPKWAQIFLVSAKFFWRPKSKIRVDILKNVVKIANSSPKIGQIPLLNLNQGWDLRFCFFKGFISTLFKVFLIFCGFLRFFFRVILSRRAKNRRKKKATGYTLLGIISNSIRDTLLGII